MEDYGYWEDSGNGKIVNSYAVGKVAGVSETGGLAGVAFDNTCTATNSYWIKETTGQSTSVVGTAKTVSALTKKAIYNSWNFSTIWAIDEGKSLAYLQGRSVPDAIYNLVKNYPVMEGTGTSDNPYIITNAEQLKKINEDLTAYYKLGADIDLSGISDWEPIGGGYNDENPFTGSFDGDGYTISNLKITASTDDQGLFAHIKNATIKNLTIKDYNIYSTGSAIGALAGSSNNSNITNVNTIGNLCYGKESVYVGGLVGWFEAETKTSTISKCYTAGTIRYNSSTSTSTAYGGFVGGITRRNVRN